MKNFEKLRSLMLAGGILLCLGCGSEPDYVGTGTVEQQPVDLLRDQINVYKESGVVDSGVETLADYIDMVDDSVLPPEKKAALNESVNKLMSASSPSQVGAIADEMLEQLPPEGTAPDGGTS